MPLAKSELKKHIHKLKRHRYPSGNTVFFCVLDCSFKVDTALSVGKKNICWRCGNEFIMDEYSLRLAKPHCSACHQPKNKKEVSEDASIRIIVDDSKEEVTILPSVETSEANDSLQSLRDRLNKAIHDKPVIFSEEVFEEDEDI